MAIGLDYVGTGQCSVEFMPCLLEPVEALTMELLSPVTPCLMLHSDEGNHSMQHDRELPAMGFRMESRSGTPAVGENHE